MDNLEKDKYVVLYLDLNEYVEYTRLDIFFKKIYDEYGLKIINFLLNFENIKINNTDILINIYQDEYIQDYIIKDCFCIIYCSKFKKSKNLIDLLLKYKKNVINFNNIEYILDKNIEELINYEQDKTIFIEYYKNLIDNNQQKDIFYTKNIKLIWNKKIKDKSLDDYNNSENSDKIHLITYYKETDIKLLNIIQKKCIFENYKNKSIIKLLIIGKNLIEEFKDILEHDIAKKIILHDISLYTINREVTKDTDKKNTVFPEMSKDNLETLDLLKVTAPYPEKAIVGANEIKEQIIISFKDLIDIANTIFLNKIICILRSDIILPNQNELDDLEIDLLSNKNQLFSVSRIERLINGNLVKSDKLHKILNCTEQDGWFFKSPLNINDENMINLNKINFYDKHSELYFNNILKNEGYNIINNTKKYKIIRLLYENNIENRDLLNINNVLDIKNNLENIFLLPDNNTVDKISIDQILSSCKLDNTELYYIKCDLINKYFKGKIFN
jgi:hypothetical protein